MNINVLFFGQPRYLGNGYVYRSIYNEVLNKYPGSKVYAHMWFDLETSNLKSSSWVEGQPYVPYDAPSRFWSLYNPEKFLIEKPRNFSIKSINSERLLDSRYYSEENVSNAFSQMYSIKEVSRLALEDSSEDDLYILTRYDGILQRIPELDNIEFKNHLIIPMGTSEFNDLVWIFGKKVLEKLTEMKTDGLHAGQEALNHPIPEEFKKLWFVDKCKGIKLVKYNMYSEIVRSI